MKFSGQTKDGVIDNLLRAYVSRPGNPHQACPDFDPDQANAYIEHTLTGASRSRYERHLSECTACRKNIIALVRFAEADRLASGSPTREIPRSTWLDGARRVFGALSQPQWAMAAAAVIVLAISLPLILSRTAVQDQSQPLSKQSSGDNAQSAIAPVSPAVSTKSPDADSSPAANAIARQRESREEKPGEKSELLAKNVPPAESVSEPVDALAARANAAKKTEERSGAQPVDEQRRAEKPVVQSPPQGGAAPGSQVAKGDLEQNRQQQPEKDSKRLSEGADQEFAQKEKAGKAEDAVAPPAPAASSEAGRVSGGLKRTAPKLALRDSSGEAVRADEIRAGGRKFVFRDSTWTDKDFDPAKDLPVVTIIRDSNVYKELIAKRAGLRSIMERFRPTERAIIVYKGTVYKLIPQQGDK